MIDARSSRVGTRQSACPAKLAALSARIHVRTVLLALQVPSPPCHCAQPDGVPSTLAVQAAAAAAVGWQSLLALVEHCPAQRYESSASCRLARSTVLSRLTFFSQISPV